MQLGDAGLAEGRRPLQRGLPSHSRGFYGTASLELNLGRVADSSQARGGGEEAAQSWASLWDPQAQGPEFSGEGT